MTPRQDHASAITAGHARANLARTVPKSSRLWPWVFGPGKLALLRDRLTGARNDRLWSLRLRRSPNVPDGSQAIPSLPTATLAAARSCAPTPTRLATVMSSEDAPDEAHGRDVADLAREAAKAVQAVPDCAVDIPVRHRGLDRVDEHLHPLQRVRTW